MVNLVTPSSKMGEYLYVNEGEVQLVSCEGRGDGSWQLGVTFKNGRGVTQEYAVKEECIKVAKELNEAVNDYNKNCCNK